jgi:sulfoacetaldehyde dehydrogenase
MAAYAREIAKLGQSRIDEAVTALAWSIYKPENARRFAELAVEVTGLGDVDSKIIKNQRKTFGTLRDLLRARSTGIIEEIPEKGIVKYAKPVGVVGAVTPSTNPSATPVNKAMMALKGGNAIVIAPPPTAWAATKPVVDEMRAALEKIDLPPDLVQILPDPVTREATTRLMELADLVVVTGSQVNVRQAYRSGKPAIGVGLGNAPVIIDASADLADAAHKIMLSKTFDHATSCSSENSLIILDAVYDKAIAALQAEGGYLASASEKQRIVERLWQGGKLNRAVIAQGPQALVEVFELGAKAKGCKFVMV